MGRDGVRHWLLVAGRQVMGVVVRRIPGRVADRLRTPSPVPGPTAPGGLRRALLTCLCHGGIPAAVPEFPLPDNPEYVFVSADSLVLAQLYWFGEQGWEPELLPWWRYLCRRASGVLELGSNVGYFAVQGVRAAPGVAYTAVEPHPVSVALCRANLELNGVTSVRLVAAAAAANADGPTRLVVPHDQRAAPTVAFIAGDGELPPRMAGPVAATMGVSTVDIRTLLPGVDLVKLDVEGQEHALLSAADDHLRAHRPTVVVEVLPDTRRLRGLLARICRELGYGCYVPQPGRLARLHPDRLDGVALLDEFGVQDLILSADPGLPLTVAELGPAGLP